MLPFNENILGAQFKLGNKFYLFNKDKYHTGFQVSWLKTGVSIGINTFLFELSPLQLGFINGYAFNDNTGIEANINFGYGIFADADNELFHTSYNFNPALKFRYGNLTSDVNYNLSFLTEHLNNGGKGRLSLLGLSIGLKL
jgi:hypothetical protein